MLRASRSSRSLPVGVPQPQPGFPLFLLLGLLLQPLLLRLDSILAGVDKALTHQLFQLVLGLLQAAHGRLVLLVSRRRQGGAPLQHGLLLLHHPVVLALYIVLEGLVLLLEGLHDPFRHAEQGAHHQPPDRAAQNAPQAPHRAGDAARRCGRAGRDAAPRRRGVQQPEHQPGPRVRHDVGRHAPRRVAQQAGGHCLQPIF